MTPAEAVGVVARFVATHDELTEDDVISALRASGATASEAQRAYNFTQTAWARAYLSSLPVEFSDEFICFTAAGDVVEAGRLPDEPHYKTAAELAPQLSAAPGFKRLTLLSSEASAIGSALDAGSKPEDLVLAPVFVFLESPTDEGMQNAQRIMTAQIEAIQQRTLPQRAKKPWWKFWG